MLSSVDRTLDLLLCLIISPFPAFYCKHQPGCILTVVMRAQNLVKILGPCTPIFISGQGLMTSKFQLNSMRQVHICVDNLHIGVHQMYATYNLNHWHVQRCQPENLLTSWTQPTSAL